MIDNEWNVFENGAKEFGHLWLTANEAAIAVASKMGVRQSEIQRCKIPMAAAVFGALVAARKASEKKP